ncbi:M16 family metallopeptidase [Arsenicicoccus cauae]|uniref:M16 family metallopeptidase n=1 Tax=Arsenicicoccus cauae TaxID=2663847 RepID=UPI00370D8447
MTVTPTPARPEVAPPGPWSFPEPTTTRLANGLTLQTFHTPGQYVASVRLAVPVVPAQEARELEGILALMSRTFDEGTEDHSAEEFAELLERAGVALGSSTSEFGLMLDLDVPVRRLDRGLELLAECVQRPAYPDDEVDRARRKRLADIEQENADPRSRAVREFAATFYTPGSRASRPSGGSPETVRSITAPAVRDFHRRHVGPTGTVMIVAGDLSSLGAEPARALHDLVEGAFGAWRPQPVAPTGAQAPARREDACRIVVVDRPGSVQSELYIGCLGPDRRNGWGAYPVLSFLIGGAPQARVDAVLREDKGYTYGLRTAFVPRAEGGLFVASGSVRADVTGESVGLLLDILEKAREGFTPAEVRAGVDFVIQTAPARYATADAVADEAAGLALEKLPPRWVTEMFDETRSLTGEALAEAYARADVGRWTIVVVGDADQVADQVRVLGRGDVEVRRRSN